MSAGPYNGLPKPQCSDFSIPSWRREHTSLRLRQGHFIKKSWYFAIGHVVGFEVETPLYLKPINIVQGSAARHTVVRMAAASVAGVFDNRHTYMRWLTIVNVVFGFDSGRIPILLCSVAKVCWLWFSMYCRHCLSCKLFQDNVYQLGLLHHVHSNFESQQAVWWFSRMSIFSLNNHGSSIPLFETFLVWHSHNHCVNTLARGIEYYLY